jgi:glycosyltransferase involved in cell wall biosynthesis
MRVRRKAEALVGAGYSVDVLALRGREAKKTYTLEGVTVRTISLGKKRGSLVRYAYEYAAFFLWAMVRVTVQMMRRRYAVVDVNTLPDFLVFAAIFARWMGAKVVLDMHEITPEFYMSKYGIAKESRTIRLLEFLEKVSFDFADHVITVNEPIQNLLIDRGLPRTKSTVIMNSVDEGFFASNSKSSAAVDATASPASFVMMYHGTITGIYGLAIAIEAFYMAQEDMPGAEFWIMSRDPDSGLEQLVQQRGLASKVLFCGFVPPADIPTWLNRCDVGILPMRHDILLEFACPNKLSEFIIMGKPVVISRLKAIKHYFSESALAYFEPNNPAELAKQIVRLYHDCDLRTRLASRAREEYAPIRWDVMKQRYLTLMEEMVDPVRRTAEISAGVRCMPQMTDDRATLKDVKTAARKLLSYCRANDWAGYDPYDALNSRLFMALPALQSRVPRLALTQILKRSPINVRGLLQIPKTQNPKGIALFLSALLKAPELCPGENEDLVGSLTQTLVALRSTGTPYWCWGYSFPWQTRTVVVPRGTPNLVCTTFVAGALLDLYEQSHESEQLGMAVSAAEYILKELYWTDGSVVAGFSYPLPSLRNQVHNANFLAAALFCRVYKHTGDERFLAPALRAARYSAGKQHPDGSWAYGEGSKQHWVDNFHTGYNLGALRSISRDIGTTEFDSVIRHGFEFYREHFFRQDGAARYFHNRTYPLDIHCVAQSIITLLEFRDLDPGNVPLAHSVFRWAMNHMWDDRGFFYYRVLRLGTVRTSYMRWSQAWMLRALSELLCEVDTATKQPQTKDSRDFVKVC